MTDQTVSAAVARQVPLAGVIEPYAGEFGKVLPAHVGQERFIRWSLSLLRKATDPGTTDVQRKQAEAWQRVLSAPAGQLSVMQALMDAASLGLEPGREYHLIPFGAAVTGITDYRGEIKLITNAERCSVVAQLVRKADEFAMTGANVPPRHDADWFADRGDVVGGYAFVDYGGRYSLVARMNEAEFLRHREKARTKTVWDEWPEAMRLKTLVHQVRKFVPWSVEWRA